jgi:hypothetical protein
MTDTCEVHQGIRVDMESTPTNADRRHDSTR